MLCQQMDEKEAEIKKLQNEKNRQLADVYEMKSVNPLWCLMALMIEPLLSSSSYLQTRGHQCCHQRKRCPHSFAGISFQQTNRKHHRGRETHARQALATKAAQRIGQWLNQNSKYDFQMWPNYQLKSNIFSLQTQFRIKLLQNGDEADSELAKKLQNAPREQVSGPRFQLCHFIWNAGQTSSQV